MLEQNSVINDKDVFNYIADFLLKQNEKSIEFKDCRYHLGNLRCAIGCLIKPEFYHQIIEGATVTNAIVKEAIAKSIPNWEINDMMLVKLQEVHDVYEVEQWSLCFSRFEFVNNSYFLTDESKYPEKQNDNTND